MIAPAAVERFHAFPENYGGTLNLAGELFDRSRANYIRYYNLALSRHQEFTSSRLEVDLFLRVADQWLPFCRPGGQFYSLMAAPQQRIEGNSFQRLWLRTSRRRRWQPAVVEIARALEKSQ